MKELVLAEYKKFQMLEVPIPLIQADEVLIRVKAVGNCGSEVHGMDGSTGRRIPPTLSWDTKPPELSKKLEQM
jgi:L-iditol 2-dehydrogenase